MPSPGWSWAGAGHQADRRLVCAVAAAGASWRARRGRGPPVGAGRCCWSGGRGDLLLAAPYYLLAWPELWAAIGEQSAELGGGYQLSYTWQFIGTTPYLFELQNLVRWSLGLLGVAALAWGGAPHCWSPEAAPRAAPPVEGLADAVSGLYRPLGGAVRAPYVAAGAVLLPVRGLGRGRPRAARAGGARGPGARCWWRSPAARPSGAWPSVPSTPRPIRASPPRPGSRPTSRPARASS